VLRGGVSPTNLLDDGDVIVELALGEGANTDEREAERHKET
jgi:hypothetical protein